MAARLLDAGSEWRVFRALQLANFTTPLVLEDDTVVVRADGREERHRHPPAQSDGSQHPDWFGPVTDEFMARVQGQDSSRRNLDEAAVCIAVECGARESSRRGGAAFPLAARVGSAG